MYLAANQYRPSVENFYPLTTTYKYLCKRGPPKTKMGSPNFARKLVNRAWGQRVEPNKRGGICRREQSAVDAEGRTSYDRDGTGYGG